MWGRGGGEIGYVRAHTCTAVYAMITLNGLKTQTITYMYICKFCMCISPYSLTHTFQSISYASLISRHCFYKVRGGGIRSGIDGQGLCSHVRAITQKYTVVTCTLVSCTHWNYLTLQKWSSLLVTKCFPSAG